MDFNKLKLKFEPEKEEEKDKWISLKAKFEPEISDVDEVTSEVSKPALNFDKLKVKFESQPTDWKKLEMKKDEPVEDVTTPAPETTSVQTQVGLGAKAVSGATLPKPTKTVEDFDWVESQKYHPEKMSGIEKGVRVLGSAITKLPKQIKAAALSVSQGAKGASVANKDWADEYIKSAQKDQEIFVQEMIDKYGDINILPGIKLSDVAQMPQSMAFSATSMGAGLAVGVPTALIPIPGSRILAWGLGTVASGKAAYEMSAYQIMQTYLDVKNEEKIASTGQELTLEEENNLKQGFNNLAKQYALWEAVPEAISNLAFVGLLTAPLTKMVGKTIAGRIVNKVAALYGEEVLTETITEIGQKGVMGKAGLPGGGEINWESPKEWVEAFKAVAPQTFLLTTIMGGTGTLVMNTNKVVKSLKNEAKDSEVKAELIKKVENKETLKEAVKEEQFKEEISKGEYKEKPVSITKETTPEAPAEIGKEIFKESISESESIAEKQSIKKRTVEGVKSGELTGAVRFGSAAELEKALKDNKLPISKEYDEIHAQPIIDKDDDYFAVYGPYNKHTVGIVVPSEYTQRKPDAHTKEVIVNPDVPVEKLKFIIKDKVYNYDEIAETTEIQTPEAIVAAGEGVEGTEGKVSKIAGSIEAKSIEQGLTKGFGHLAEYTPIVIKEQAQKASDLINTDINEARKIIRGEMPLPEGLKGTALITAMEERIKKTADGELASELANSPLVSGTSAAAQELRLAAERDPASPVKAIQDINKLLDETIKKRYPGKILNKAKTNLVSKIKSEIKNANTAYSWKAFIESIQC